MVDEMRNPVLVVNEDHVALGLAFGSAVQARRQGASARIHVVICCCAGPTSGFRVVGVLLSSAAVQVRLESASGWSPVVICCCAGPT